MTKHTTDETETLAEATKHRPVPVTATGTLQQVCGHAGCRAQRLSRPDGTWRPCWHDDCKTPEPPQGLTPTS